MPLREIAQVIQETRRAIQRTGEDVAFTFGGVTTSTGKAVAVRGGERTAPADQTTDADTSTVMLKFIPTDEDGALPERDHLVMFGGNSLRVLVAERVTKAGTFSHVLVSCVR